MKKLKNMLILLLAITLIGCGAILPGIVAAVMDRNGSNQSGTKEMPTLDWNVSDANGEPRTLSPLAKINLLRNGQTIAITDKDAAMTEADVNAALEIAMREYEDAGIFQWFDYDAWNVQPVLCVDPDAPDNYGIFWTVTIINKKPPYQTLAVDIDDETGNIYSIRYDIYGEYSLDGVWERNYAVMDAVAHAYLTQLGLLDGQQNVEPNIVYAELDGEVLCGGLYLENEEYGLQRIEFYVTGTGSFWIYFPA